VIQPGTPKIKQRIGRSKLASGRKICKVRDKITHIRNYEWLYGT
jgi:hypothetical protein